jgi:hypothetical protein
MTPSDHGNRNCALLLLAVLSVAACKKSQPPEPRRTKPVAAVEAPTPMSDKAIAEGEQDTSWIAGTWKKDGEWRWLLFNLPSDVAELAGNPARVGRRGKVSIHEKYISVLFPDAAIELEANDDHSQLVARGAGVYRRGAPP